MGSRVKLRTSLGPLFCQPHLVKGPIVALLGEGAAVLDWVARTGLPKQRAVSRSKKTLRGTAMQISRGWLLQAAGTASAKALGKDRHDGLQGQPAGKDG